MMKSSSYRFANVFLRDEEWKCTFDYYPASYGSMYRRNGDPGDPPKSAELILEMLIRNDVVLKPEDLTEEELASVEQQAIDSAIEADRAAIEDWYEQRSAL